MLAPRELVSRMRCAAGIDDLPVRIERSGSFSSYAEIADRFRSHRTFLVGDAAHRVTPRGGTGMNAAFQGGHELGWRLAWVLRGWADAGLLEGYERERRPLAEHNVARSADPDGTRRSPGEELRVDLAGRIGHHWITVAGRRRSTLDLLGRGLTLVTGPNAGAWKSGGEGARRCPAARPSEPSTRSRHERWVSAPRARFSFGPTGFLPSRGRATPAPDRRCSGRSPTSPAGTRVGGARRTRRDRHLR